jgi:hypothetical protein
MGHIVNAILIYMLIGIFIFFVARMAIRFEMSKHPDPSYRVAISFIRSAYSASAVAYILVIIVGILVLHLY